MQANNHENLSISRRVHEARCNVSAALTHEVPGDLQRWRHSVAATTLRLTQNQYILLRMPNRLPNNDWLTKVASGQSKWLGTIFVIPPKR